MEIRNKKIRDTYESFQVTLEKSIECVRDEIRASRMLGPFRNLFLKDIKLRKQKLLKTVSEDVSILRLTFEGQMQETVQETDILTFNHLSERLNVMLKKKPETINIVRVRLADANLQIVLQKAN